MLEKILLVISGLFALFFGAKSFFATRDADKAKAERDEALVDAEKAQIKAQAKTVEAETLREQARKEDEIRSDPDVAARLDGMFKQ